MNKLKILLVLHKSYPYPDIDELLPIQVNKANAVHKLSIQGDDEGENISPKNANYCELTAMYWAWKNLSNTEYIGLYHYRRYLLLEENKFIKILKHWTKKALKRKAPPVRVPKSEIHDIDTLQKRLRYTLNRISPRKDRIYLAYPQYLSGFTVREHYQKCHSLDQWNILKDVFRELHPNEEKAFETLERSLFLSPFNMIILSKEEFDAYCEWLFTILFAFEQRVTVSKEQYQSRIFGFIAERLLNLYFKEIRKDLAVRYLESSFFEANT